MKSHIALLLFVISCSAFGSELLPNISPDPIVAKALQTISYKHPEIKSSDLKLAQIECVYGFNSDFDPRDSSTAFQESKKGSNAIVTFVVISSRRDISDAQTKMAEYDSWKVVVAPDSNPKDMHIEKSRLIFSRGK